MAALCWMGCGSSGGDECQPVVELCNGLDDDCDGLTDEDFPVEASCTQGLGVCAAAGVYLCAEDGASAICDAVPGEPSDEACNQLDDDCDGQTDEDVLDCCVPASEDTCGVNVGACTAGVKTCSASGAWEACLSGGVPVILPGELAESCNDVDDDCDGQTDEEFSVGGVCSLGVGACARSGFAVCSPDGTGTECNAEPGEPGTESCNGVDDDCDGQTDEELQALLCPKQEGVCMGSTSTCADGWLVCGRNEYGPGYEETEATCDGLDNDCDATTDEGVQTTYYRDYDADSHGNLNSTRLACSLPVGYAHVGDDCNDDAQAVHPGANEKCDNDIDEDCDGQTDEPGCSW